MSVPGRSESAALLLSLNPPAWFLRHARAVAEIAAWLAWRAERRGVTVDRRLVEAAGLLHDVDKLLPSGDRDRRRPHGDGSALWLARAGHRELGEAVAAHPVTQLADESFAAWLAAADGATLETRIVAYADKRAGQRLESLDARFASWARRYPPPADSSARRAAEALSRRMRDGAELLERAVCESAGVEPSAVGRLRWTARALGRVTSRESARARGRPMLAGAQGRAAAREASARVAGNGESMA